MLLNLVFLLSRSSLKTDIVLLAGITTLQIISNSMQFFSNESSKVSMMNICLIASGVNEHFCLFWWREESRGWRPEVAIQKSSAIGYPHRCFWIFPSMKELANKTYSNFVVFSRFISAIIKNHHSVKEVHVSLLTIQINKEAQKVKKDWNSSDRHGQW